MVTPSNWEQGRQCCRLHFSLCFCRVFHTLSYKKWFWLKSSDNQDCTTEDKKVWKKLLICWSFWKRNCWRQVFGFRRICKKRNFVGNEFLVEFDLRSGVEEFQLILLIYLLLPHVNRLCLPSSAFALYIFYILRAYFYILSHFNVNLFCFFSFDL